MNRWKWIGWMAALAGCGLLGAVTILSGSKTQAIDEVSTTAGKPGKLIVHEWGTFTSFSGSNGTQLDFRPLLNEDLPSFVLDREAQSGIPLLTKGRIRSRIRMETPVTYFYTDQERTVRASVEFPEGLLTEFYPPVVDMAPSFDSTRAGREEFGKAKLDWGEIHLIPTSLLTPRVADQQTATWMTKLIEERIVPNDGNPSNHYYHARQTDSAFVHWRTPLKNWPAVDHIEKFLFYRGLGRFDQPLKVEATEAGQIRVTNRGAQPLQSLFKVCVAGQTITVAEMDSLAGGATAEFRGAMQEVTTRELMNRVAQALVREDLYPREATAMVNTWADSWFAEEGTRIFYMVPRETTDKLLPLTISPPPDESVRVLVGRVEVLTPRVEKSLMEIVRANRDKREVLRVRKAKGDAPADESLPVPQELLKLGRLAEPALVRIRELVVDDTISAEAGILMTECMKALQAQQ